MLCIRCTYVSHPIHYAKGQLIGVVYHNHHIVCKIEFFVKFFFPLSFGLQTHHKFLVHKTLSMNLSFQLELGVSSSIFGVHRKNKKNMF